MDLSIKELLEGQSRVVRTLVSAAPVYRTKEYLGSSPAPSELREKCFEQDSDPSVFSGFCCHRKHGYRTVWQDMPYPYASDPDQGI